MPELPTLRDIYLARRRIAPLVRRTPLAHSPALSACSGAVVDLKLECWQETGSFKLRGASNRILGLTPEEKARGIVTVSSGNHGRAVAYVAGRLGMRAVVCLSKRIPRNKVEAIRGLGAEVEIHGESYDEAELRSRALQEERGLVRIDPFDDPLVICGQGTVGLELLEDLPEIDTAIVPVGGGGLIGGIGLALKSADPAIRVIGVSMERGPALHDCLKAGALVPVVEEETLAEALAGGIPADNQYTFRLAQRHVDEIVLVSEEEIAGAMAFALQVHHLVVEGGGAVGIAALLSRRVAGLGRHVAVVVSGGNVDTSSLQELTARHGDRRG